MKVYQYVMFVTGDEPELITKEPVTVLAKNEETVKRVAARALPSIFEDKLDEVQIEVHPFQ